MDWVCLLFPFLCLPSPSLQLLTCILFLQEEDGEGSKDVPIDLSTKGGTSTGGRKKRGMKGKATTRETNVVVDKEVASDCEEVFVVEEELVPATEEEMLHAVGKEVSLLNS